MILKYANNASSFLASDIELADTSLTVSTGDGASFPTLGVDEYFVCTLISPDGADMEIIHVTARAGDVFTIERAKESTTAKDFSTGSLIENRLTAGTMNLLVQTADEVETLLDGVGTAAYEDTGTTEGTIPVLGSGGKLGIGVVPTGTTENTVPVLGSGGKLAWSTSPSKVVSSLTDAATITPDLTAADAFTLTITAARNLGDATLPGVGAWPITVTGDFALSTHVNWTIDPNGLAADPAEGTRIFWMYSLDGTSKNILIVAV